MKEITRRIAVVVGAAVVSVGLMGAVAVPAHAGSEAAPSSRDSSWGR